MCIYIYIWPSPGLAPPPPCGVGNGGGGGGSGGGGGGGGGSSCGSSDMVVGLYSTPPPRGVGGGGGSVGSMYINIYVYMNICIICICICIYTYWICIYIYIRIYLSIYIYVYIYYVIIYFYVYVCIWICTCICIYVYDSICWAWKRLVHCAEQLLELKICISPQFRANDPPNPARGFIQQNENVRLATAACMQNYGNVSFVTVACAKCMRYGGVGDHTIGGGVGIRDPDSYIPNLLAKTARKLCVSQELRDMTQPPLCWLEVKNIHNS